MRDRVVGLRRVRAGSLRANRWNWRGHPAGQRRALAGMLEEVGFADALLVRELDDGTLELIDGHLRAELAAEEEVPVLVLDVTEEEAAKLLALFDPLGDLAEVNREGLRALVEQLDVERDALRGVLEELVTQRETLDVGEGKVEPALAASYQVVVDCASEGEQRELFERWRGEGLRCRLLTL